jgi:hypothetical protein
MLSRWVAGPCEGISNQLRSTGAALQQLLSLITGGLLTLSVAELSLGADEGHDTIRDSVLDCGANCTFIERFYLSFGQEWMRLVELRIHQALAADKAGVQTS